MKHQFKVKMQKKAIIFVVTILIILSSMSLQAHTVKTASFSMIKSHSNVDASHVIKPSLYDLLIITPSQFIQDLFPLVSHKISVGIRTRMVTLDDVYDQMYWFGRDKPEKIKYFIQHALENWGISYVLLVGDFRQLPVRYCYNADVDHGFYEPCFISELYYADIYDQNGNFSTWDPNGNGIFGEWTGQIAEDQDIDLYPDVAVGRLACRNAIEVRTMVKKIITYETTTYGNPWFNKLVLIAGDTYPESLNPNWTGYEGEENTVRVMENMTGFEFVKLWTSDKSFTGPRDVRQAINQGCGFLYLDGHANPFRWSTHPPNDANTWVEGLTVVSMSRLRNKNMLPVCVVGGCHNLQFDVHLGKLREDPFAYFSWISECWGWKLTRKIGGGSIATLGCTGLGMTKEDKESFSGAGDYLEPTFFYEYHVNQTNVLGDVWKKTICNYLTHYPIDWNTPAAWDFAIDAKTVQQWALLGDSSLQIGGYPAPQ